MKEEGRKMGEDNGGEQRIGEESLGMKENRAAGVAERIAMRKVR